MEIGVNPDSRPWADARMGAVRHADGMNINMYAILVLMVVRQIREHSLDLRSVAVPGCR